MIVAANIRTKNLSKQDIGHFDQPFVDFQPNPLLKLLPL